MTQRSRVNAIRLWRHYVAIFALAGLLLVGCTALPNTSGYTTATIQVKQAVATVGKAVETELALALSAKAVSDSSTRVEAFKQSWKPTVASVGAMVAYAQSIEQIVDAGNKGARSAKQVADSASRLVEAVKVDATTGAAAKAVGLSADTGALVYGEYAKFRAAKSLEEALDRVGPTIAKVSELVQAQIADAERLFSLQIAAQAMELESQYQDWTNSRDKLEKMKKTATNRLLSLIDPESASAGNSSTAPGSEAGAEESKNERIKQLEILIGRMETVRNQIAPYLEEYEAKLSQLRQRGKAGRSIISASENSVAAWSTAHQEMVQAVKQRKPVNVESLTAAVIETRTLIQRWREL